MLSIQKSGVIGALIVGMLLSGCGSSNNAPNSPSGGASSTSTASPSGSTSRAASTSGPSASALSADARSAATGDIPDNQVFLAFSSKAAGFAIKYPEGWTQSGTGHSRSFRDKNNLVRVLISHGAPPTRKSVSAQLTALRQSDPMLTFRAPHVVKLGSGSAVRVVYTTESAPNPVTGKRVELVVDRYVLSTAGRVATVDLGTPIGVDNVDAYRMMIQSFRWL